MSLSSFDALDTSAAKVNTTFNFNDFEVEGEGILAAAKEEAQRIKDGVEAERQAALSAATAQGKKEGYAVGFEEGKTAGFSAGQQQGRDEIMPQINPAISAFNDAAESLEQGIDALLHQAQTDFIELVKIIALKVIHKYVEKDSELIARSMESISEYIVQKNSLVINLHPDDIAIAKDWLRENMARFDKLKSLKLNADTAITRGGCTISTREGGVDVSIETAIEAIVEEL